MDGYFPVPLQKIKTKYIIFNCCHCHLIAGVTVKFGDQVSMRAFPVFPSQQFLVCASKTITSTRLARITSPNTIRGLGRQSTKSVDVETQ